MSTTIHILNPAAGKGILPSEDSLSGEVYVTRGVGDAEDHLKKRLSNPLYDGETYRIYVYGGDGTLNEVVNGIMQSGVGERVTLTPMPTGSGNDFHRVSSALTDKTVCDVIKYNDRYALNILNIGFDCAAAATMRDYKNKPFVSGSFAYVLGVATEFIKKTATKMKITLTDTDGNIEVLEDEYLLCAIANGKFYGGGFKAAPAADISDGIFDVIIVKNVSRMKFVSLIGDYKKGSHIDEKTLECLPKLADVLTYKRAVSIKISGAHRYAADGEIIDDDIGELFIENIPHAINIAPIDFSEKVEPATV